MDGHPPPDPRKVDEITPATPKQDTAQSIQSFFTQITNTVKDGIEQLVETGKNTSILEGVQTILDKVTGSAGSDSDDSDDGPTIYGKGMDELFASHPNKMLRVIDKNGVVKLGSFKIREEVLRKVFRKRRVVTQGSDEMCDFDWKKMWDDHLAKARTTTPKGPTVYRRVEAYVVTIKGASGLGNSGLLEPLVMRWEAGACPQGVFSLPAVQAVVSYKWHSWARKCLLIELVLFVLWLLSFLAFVRTYKAEHLQAWWWDIFMSGPQGQACVIFSFLALLFMVPFAYISIVEVLHNKLVNWISLWNVVDACAEAMQVVCVLVYMSRLNIESGHFDVILSIQTVLLVMKIQYFCRAFTQVKSAFIDNLVGVLKKLFWFLLFLLLTMISFALAFYILFRHDETQFWEFSNIWHSFCTLFSSTFKRFSYDPLYGSRMSNIVVPLFSFYLFLNTVTLLNVLISMFVSTHRQLVEDTKSLVVSSRAQMIVELETAVPRFFLKHYEVPYVHFLRVVPPHDLKSVWTEIGHAEKTAESLKTELNDAMKSAEDAVMTHVEGLSKKIEAAILARAEQIAKEETDIVEDSYPAGPE